MDTCGRCGKKFYRCTCDKDLSREIRRMQATDTCSQRNEKEVSSDCEILEESHDTLG